MKSFVGGQMKAVADNHRDLASLVVLLHLLGVAVLLDLATQQVLISSYSPECSNVQGTCSSLQ